MEFTFSAGPFVAPPAPPANYLYVNPSTGDDSRSKATARSASTPWATIGRAAWGSTNRATPNSSEAASAGDTVIITPGTYSGAGTSGGRFDVLYNPANSGTSGNPIRFEVTNADPTNTATLATLTLTSGNGPVIGANARDYIQWSGFYVNETDAASESDTGPCTWFDCGNGLIENSRLVGNPAWTAREGDNYPGVRLNTCDGPISIKNCVIKDYGGDTSGEGDRNHCGVEIYQSPYPILVEHCYIENCGSGIYAKANNTGTDTLTVRFCEFVDNRYAMQILRMPHTESVPCLIYQNLVRGGNSHGFWINAFDNGSTDAKWIRIFNNTFYGGVGAGLAAYNFATFQSDCNFLWQNNIVVGGTHNVRMDTSNVTTNLVPFTIDRNLYHNASTAFSTLAGSNVSFSTWQGTHGQDANGTTGDPLFVNAAGNDFHLDTGSPALTLGRVVHSVGGSNGDTIPAGCYITGSETIGLE